MGVRWAEFAVLEPVMAEAGRKLLYQFDIGLGYLATVRADGAPRIHPVCPIISDGGLYGLIIPGPKQADLRRDGRFSIHACNPQDRDDEFTVSGAARLADESTEAVRAHSLRRPALSARPTKPASSSWSTAPSSPPIVLATKAGRRPPTSHGGSTSGRSLHLTTKKGTAPMSTWADFELDAPALAAAGRQLLFQAGPGYAFLGTVRKDGGPRIHPICPVIADVRLYAFIVNIGPKYRDLLRDGRFAMHAFPAPQGGEEFYITGTAQPVDEPGIRAGVVQSTGGMLGTHDFEALFTFDIEAALHTRWEGWGGPAPWPTYAKWKAPA